MNKIMMLILSIMIFSGIFSIVEKATVQNGEHTNAIGSIIEPLSVTMLYAGDSIPGDTLIGNPINPPPPPFD
jgi:hypothetical protein